MSSRPTDLFTFFKASKKSSFLNGTFTSYSNFRIFSIFFKPPAFFNILLIGMYAASRHTLVMSAPLYPSVLWTTKSKSSPYSIVICFKFIFTSSLLPVEVGKGMYILFYSLLLKASSKSQGLLVAARTITNLFWSFSRLVAPSIWTNN